MRIWGYRAHCVCVCVCVCDATAFTVSVLSLASDKKRALPNTWFPLLHRAANLFDMFDLYSVALARGLQAITSFIPPHCQTVSTCRKTFSLDSVQRTIMRDPTSMKTTQTLGFSLKASRGSAAPAVPSSLALRYSRSSSSSR